MLEINSYVRCIFVDFSKAFDIIDHAVLPDSVLNWIIDFLTERQQFCRMSAAPAFINRSIIQGCGLGPTLYIAMKSDLT